MVPTNRNAHNSSPHTNVTRFRQKHSPTPKIQQKQKKTKRDNKTVERNVGPRHAAVFCVSLAVYLVAAALLPGGGSTPSHALLRAKSQGTPALTDSYVHRSLTTPQREGRAGHTGRGYETGDFAVSPATMGRSAWTQRRRDGRRRPPRWATSSSIRHARAR